MEYHSFPVAGRTYKSVLLLESPPSNEEIARLTGDGIEGVFMGGAGLAGLPKDGLDWLVDVTTLRVLQVSGARAPRIPVAILPRLEALEWVGQNSQKIDTSQLPALRGLTVGPWKKMTGNLRECPELVELGVAGYALPDLRILDGCLSLELAKVQCRHQSLKFGWNDTPSSLRDLTVVDATVDAFDGIEALTNLEELVFDRGRRPLPEVTLDVTPLAECTRLAYLKIDQLGTLTHVDRLAKLRHLRRLDVQAGRYLPLAAPSVPLFVLRESR